MDDIRELVNRLWEHPDGKRALAHINSLNERLAQVSKRVSDLEAENGLLRSSTLDAHVQRAEKIVAKRRAMVFREVPTIPDRKREIVAKTSERRDTLGMLTTTDSTVGQFMVEITERT